MHNIQERIQKIGHTLEVLHPIKSGKEATVYRASLDDVLVAMKLYKEPEERTFRNTDEYLRGKFYRNTSERKAVAKKNNFGKSLIHTNWIRREFTMLEKLLSLGATLPKPILHFENAIFMELLGDDVTLAPRLSEITLTAEQAKESFSIVLENILLFWNTGVVHGDLSAFNILWWKQKPFIIDFPQAINRKTHPEAAKLFMRDIENVMKYFRKFSEIDFKGVYEKVKCTSLDLSEYIENEGYMTSM